jgi:K+-transporting ATPase ATPase A chain
MDWGMTAWLQLLAVVAILGALHIPLGDYMARVYTSEKHWCIERFVYRTAGVNPDREQRWSW